MLKDLRQGESNMLAGDHPSAIFQHHLS